LGLRRRPVAVKFQETPPAGMPKFNGTEPSGCSFWRLAAAGQAFYTVPSDHYNCAIGSYTHNIPLPEERTHELEQTLSFMTRICYMKMEEVPGIPRLAQAPRVVIYAPLGETPVETGRGAVRGRAWANYAATGGRPGRRPGGTNSASGPPDLYGAFCDACSRRVRAVSVIVCTPT